jgi:hypothetical protein
MCSAELPRVYELVACLKGAPKSYFRNFAASLRDNPIKLKHFIDIEVELAALDVAAWDHLKTKVGPLFMKGEKVRGWQGAFSELNEAKAYNFLVRRGYTYVEFIPRRSDAKTPDLRAKMGNVDVLCEVKTINRSKRAVRAKTQAIVSSVSSLLPAEFFSKLALTIRGADQQMAAFSLAPALKRIIYLVINFDDRLHECVDDYLVQIQEKREEFMMPGLEIILDVKPEFYSATSTSSASHILGFSSDAPWLPPPKID